MGLGARLGPPPDTVTHTPGGEEICIRFNTKRGCSANEDGSKCKFEHSCNRRGCGGKHSASKCPSKDELSDHPDAAWVKRLLHGIEHGVNLGYHGPRCHRIAKNLTSAFQHPHIIDKEIQKEVDLGRILGPYTSPPIPSLQCSGVGVVSKKSGGWRMIMHLSAPPDRSILQRWH